MTGKRLSLLALGFLAVIAAPAAEFEIINMDDPGVGLNDPTPADPVGGNSGTTLGAQRMRVLERVGEIWGELLQSDIVIRVEATTTTFSCAGGSTTLATAGTTRIYRSNSFPIGNTWYHSALADALGGFDRTPGENDIRTRFNLGLDEDPGCSGFGGWYYGLDFKNGTQTDLLATMLHEFGHGLGFANFIDDETGALFNGFDDIYSTFTYDTEAEQGWNDMTNAQRMASTINDPNVVWNGPNVTAHMDEFLTRPAEVTTSATGVIESRAGVFGDQYFQNVSAEAAFADDGFGNPTQGCNELINDLSGKIALIDRGSCDFSTKALNAEQAGAIGAIIINNQAGLTTMSSGSDGDLVTIPAVMITMTDGETIRQALAGGSVTITLGRDADQPLTGTNSGFVRLNAEDPVNPGSSISHWTRDTTPNLLMEPAINDDLAQVDLTLYQMQDIGWTINAVAADAPDRLVYPWLSYNDQFDTVFVINNTSASDAIVELTGRRSEGDPFTTEISVPAGGFLESPIDQIFTGIDSGSGFSVIAASENSGLAGRWVTRGLQSASGDSPSQGVAVGLGNSDSGRNGNALLFGYLPNDTVTISAPVIVNTGDAAADVTLYIYDTNGALLLTDTTTLAGLEQYRPFATPISSLVTPGQTVSMVAYSPSQSITGVVFVFNLEFLEPAIGNAQVIDFTPP